MVRRHGLWLVCALTVAGFGSSSQAADKIAVQKAISRGVAFLKSKQSPNGSWDHTNQPEGATALAALALLECGVPAEDSAIRRAADFLRKQSLTLTHTYSLALCNMFFDRLGQAKDGVLIESITVRLLAGQTPLGGWTYQCPAPPSSEVRRLSQHLRKISATAARDNASPGDGSENLSRRQISPEIRLQIARLAAAQRSVLTPPPDALNGQDDNSNPQFAILGLWVSRRHGLPVDKALLTTEQRFRLTQHVDGGWAYTPTSWTPGAGSGSTPAMTCAGLLGLAVGYGVVLDAELRTAAAKAAEKGASPARPGRRRDLSKDAAVLRALFLLSTAVGQPRPRSPLLPQLQGQLASPVDALGSNYYYLWSLERVAMAYDLQTIGGKDWFGWGSDLLVAQQNLQDGSWQGSYGTVVDTSFALLFLARSNVTKDLTALLRSSRLGETVLRTSGAIAQLKEKPARFEDPLRPSGSHAGRASPAPRAKVPSESNPASPLDRLADLPGLGEAASRQSTQLAASVVKASPADRERLLAELTEGQGIIYTQALADAATKLSGEAKQRARDSLVVRLARMTADTLRDKLRDKHAEVRRAAALAIEMRGERKLIPEVIDLLKDPEPAVSRAAHAVLREMSRLDFGPRPDASPAERAAAMARWQAWWQRQGG